MQRKRKGPNDGYFLVGKHNLHERDMVDVDKSNNNICPIP